MPRKSIQDAADPVTDPVSLFNLAVKAFKKEGDQWTLNGLIEATQALVSDDASDLDATTSLDIAIKLFRSNRSDMAASLLMAAAVAYKSDMYTAKLAEFERKYGTPASEPEPDHDQATE